MSARAFADLRRGDDRIVAGVCAGIAETIDVDPTLVRLVFMILALAGGAGIALYGAIALFMHGRTWVAVAAVVAAGSLALSGLGLSAHVIIAMGLIAVGLVFMWRRGGSLRPDAPLSLAGLLLGAAGVGILLTQGGSPREILEPGAVLGGLLLIVGPWLWQLARERDEERTQRIRIDERAEVATRVHDSVLQTLALIQLHTDDPRRVAALARRQERELRSWLYGDGTAAGDSLAGALALAAAEIEELHGVRVELASGSDCPLSEELGAIVLAAREAMANAAKFSGSDEVSVYAEADESRASVFVRDRGQGFNRAEVPPDRRGLVESIEGRMARAGGSATIVSAVGSGTEVELTMPRGAE
jgi:signal transduction histidine kinase